MPWVSGSSMVAVAWSTLQDARGNAQRSEPSGVVSGMLWMEKEEEVVVRLKVGRW